MTQVRITDVPMEEKRKDLDAEKQKKLLHRLVEELSKSHMDFYYRSTSEVAFLLKSYIDGEAKLSVEEKALLSSLSQKDIQLKLSLQ
ncbi:MAG: hypothetical protein AAF950_02300 [Pseudomonadota bacterium]